MTRAVLVEKSKRIATAAPFANARGIVQTVREWYIYINLKKKNVWVVLLPRAQGESGAKRTGDSLPPGGTIHSVYINILIDSNKNLF